MNRPAPELLELQNALMEAYPILASGTDDMALRAARYTDLEPHYTKTKQEIFEMTAPVFGDLTLVSCSLKGDEKNEVESKIAKLLSLYRRNGFTGNARHRVDVPDSMRNAVGTERIYTRIPSLPPPLPKNPKKTLG